MNKRYKIRIGMYFWLGLVALFYWANGSSIMYNIQNYPFPATNVYRESQGRVSPVIETRAYREKSALTKDNKIGDTKLFGMRISHVERNALTEITFDLMAPMMLATLLYFFCYAVYAGTKKIRRKEK